MKKKNTKLLTSANRSSDNSSRSKKGSVQTSSPIIPKLSSGISLGKISFNVGDNVTLEYDSKGTLTLRCQTKKKKDTIN